ncbi:MAG: preprotein translocase subunit SecG [Blastochloris sp.]|nr:preprotein translocase subunit SecG [Blastochloris sp.]
MNILIYIATTVFIIGSILLTLVVLVQKPRSEGLGSAFGGGMTESLFGAGTTDALTKVTIWLACIFFICTLGLAMLYAHRAPAKAFSDELKKAPVAVEQSAPAAPAAPAAPEPAKKP